MPEWYWCLRHKEVEPPGACRAADRLGPYESPEEARNWRERTDARNEAWDDADAAWHGDDDEQSD